jgi:hypothetical protein
LTSDPEDVGHGFIQRARLEEYSELRLVLGHSMRELMADDVERDREAIEDLSVTVAKHHLLAVPERVVVVLAEVHRRIERQPLVVDRVPAIRVPEEVPCVTETIVRLVDRHIAARWISFTAHPVTWQLLGVIRRVDRAPLLARVGQRINGWGGGKCLRRCSEGTQRGVDRKRVRGHDPHVRRCRAARSNAACAGAECRRWGVDETCGTW